MIYLYDFEDSFTYNIYSELKEISDSISIEIINKSSILSHLQTIENEDKRICLILGPGPGHPDQYHHLHGTLSRLLKKKNIFLMGICLGHQILWELNGAKIIKSLPPVHGQALDYKVSQQFIQKLNFPNLITVQRYNSLAVSMSEELIQKHEKNGCIFSFSKKELLMAQNINLLTYQFHPESIGTTCPKVFFKPVIEFLV